jgi:cytochrome c oxidase cbb3-type subunit III
MSDFVASGWSWFVAIATVVSLLWCLWLLLVAAKRRVMAADNTTGHVWDGDLKELNNPLPRWWMGLFVLTVLFAFVYLLLYPGLGSFLGKLGWTSSGQYQVEQQRAAAALEQRYARFATASFDQLGADAEARGIGERLFLNNCAMFHGSDARGSKGFPNLTDDEWLWGGTPENIVQTITQGRQGNMPAMAAAVGSAEDVRNVANFVLSLSGSPHNNIAAQLGRSKFGVCAACHGADGRGNTALGAPNLANNIWLHGWGEAAVIEMVTKGKVNVMPAFGGRLTEPQIRILAAYVRSLSQPVASGVASAQR